MTEPQLPSDLHGYVPEAERESIAAVANRLTDERPYPSAAARSRIRERLSTMAVSAWPRPRNPARLALGYCGSGLFLLLVAAVGLAGVGPLA
jgi:hypothetical protein